MLARTQQTEFSKQQEEHMRRFITGTALSLTLALCLASPEAFAKQKPAKAMSAHAEAVKKCNDDYKAAVKTASDTYMASSKDAKTKKGKERADAMKAASKARADAMAAARTAKADCIKAAPKK
jgi:hypothetical protein